LKDSDKNSSDASESLSKRLPIVQLDKSSQDKSSSFSRPSNTPRRLWILTSQLGKPGGIRKTSNHGTEPLEKAPLCESFSNFSYSLSNL